MAEKIRFKRSVLKFDGGKIIFILWFRQRDEIHPEKDLQRFVKEWADQTTGPGDYQVHNLVNFINSKRPGLAMTEEQFTAYKNSSNAS